MSTDLEWSIENREPESRSELRSIISEVESPGHTGLMMTPEAIDASLDGVEIHDVVAENFSRPLEFDDLPIGFNPHSGAESGSWDDDE